MRFEGMNPEVKESRDGHRDRLSAIHRLSLALVAITIVLLVIGALVTSNDAGDSVPDWPLSFGRWVIGSEHFTGNVRYEYSHRFVAGLVGIITGALALW